MGRALAHSYPTPVLNYPRFEPFDNQPEHALIGYAVLPRDNHPLKHAPHTAASLMGLKWNRPYCREVGGFPLATLKQVKYWPLVGRVDNVYGDRNLFCACVPVKD